MTPEQQRLFAELGSYATERKRGQTLDQLVAVEAASFNAACRLELGGAPALADTEAAIRAQTGMRSAAGEPQAQSS